MNGPKTREGRMVIIDNYDSFTFNLAQYMGELGHDPLVFRNDGIDLAELAELEPERIVISPGPGTPDRERYFGLSLEVIKELSPTVPTLGVCLGHQGIGVAFGGRVVEAEVLYHGKTTPIEHDGKGIFAGIPNPFAGARYRSLIMDPDSIPDELEVIARGPDGEIMGVRHGQYPIYGLQFHPESILTEHGIQILANFLTITGRDRE